MQDQQAQRIIELLEELNQGVRSLISAADAQKPFRTHYKSIEAFASFDWASIGAVVVATDGDGPTVVEFQGEVFKRRSPQNKFDPAVWYSRSLGKDDAGTQQYQKLVVFKDLGGDAVDPINSKAKNAIAATAPIQAAPPAQVIAQKSQAAPSMAAQLHYDNLKKLFRQHQVPTDQWAAIARKHHRRGDKNIMTKDLSAEALEVVFYKVREELQGTGAIAADEW
ncbi:MAG: hypothetical protein HC771_22815 [Synechococcales cyanobacterium CRU_2_2]|nr:hypothetical protein [Synechococcales cyanobacterium CRU_2_2]